MSTDGQVLWWDTRRLGQPLEDLTLREKASAVGAVAMRSHGLCECPLPELNTQRYAIQTLQWIGNGLHAGQGR